MANVMTASNHNLFRARTRDDVCSWLLDVLRAVALEDHQACFFLMNLKDKRLEWQLGTEIVRACVAAGLIKLFPSGDEGGCPAEEEVLQQLSTSDPEQLYAADADEANIWVCTYLMGTRQCQSLLARHGFLDCKMALILAEGIDRRLASGVFHSSHGASILDMSPDGAARLRALAEQSSQIERIATLEVRRQAFVAELNGVVQMHLVLQAAEVRV